MEYIRQRLQTIARDNQHTLADLAIAWVLRQPALTGAIMGIRNERDARTMANGAGWTLTEQEIRAIEQVLEHCDLYSGKILNDERTSMTIDDPGYYTEP